jgi:cytochrome c peroxidase
MRATTTTTTTTTARAKLGAAIGSASTRARATRAATRPRPRATVVRNVVSDESPSDSSTPRRRALASIALAPALFAAFDVAPARAATAEERFASVRRDAVELMRADADFGPTLVRLAWHSSGTYDRMGKTGGSGGGTIRFKEELAHGGNAGLDKAIAKLEPIKKRHPDVSWADLIAFVGVVAIEEMGGPKLKFSYGRVDEMDPEAVTPDGRLPDADKGDGPGPKTRQGLRDVFYRMGFDDREIVALSGAHALGRCHADASGYVGPWSGTPLLFNNSYFVLLKGLKWEPNPDAKKFQYKDPSGNLMMLPSDIALIEDADFKKYVDVYAKSQKVFFEDFAAAFEKLETLGTSGLTALG